MVICVRVPRERGEEARRLLRSLGIIDLSYRIFSDTAYVYIPVKDEAVEVLSRYTWMETVDCSPPPRKKHRTVILPSHDLVGDVVIIRENVFEQPGVNIDGIVSGFLEVYPGIKAIYVKTRTIGEYRVPELRLLWGERVEKTIRKEYGLKFVVYLGKVYYNPRLSEEHHRIAEMVEDGEHVIDVFAGIGGFSIHIASMHDCIVIANDLNPDAYTSIIENILLNRRRLKGRIGVLNMDARSLPRYFGKGVFDRCIANLPHNSFSFMDVYRYLLGKNGVLHLYYVGRTCDDYDVEKLEGWRIEDCSRVLDYAPYIYIYRLDLVKIEE